MQPINNQNPCTKCGKQSGIRIVCNNCKTLHCHNTGCHTPGRSTSPGGTCLICKKGKCIKADNNGLKSLGLPT